ncbi:hypothetical protein [Nocardia jinanensis]|uniref:Uncharacterized protein n=1 Tax=Nocardia jinanensis TaxID=382504 RepID=A0A917RI51_9NOCA|nr:hypothetical protein [Nocardia jinanensis]GGL08222.1 hypothetical protein GCM10011588_23200 [Nocardia jinanensis]
MESKTKVAGPLAAAGAVSLGLVLIGACGIGQEDTYVPPPPIHSGPQAAEPAQYTGEPSTSVAKVLIPPSPTWRMAPEPPPRRTLPPEYQISVTASTGPGAGPPANETTRPVTLSAPPDPSTSTEPGWTTASLPSPPIEPAHTESPIPAPASTSVVIAPDPAPPQAPAPAEPPAPAPPAPAAAPRAADEQPSPETGTTEDTSTESSSAPPPDVSPAPRVAVPTTEPATPDAIEESSPAVPVPTVTPLPGSRIR